VLTCAQARNRAITIIGATKNGEDPAARRRAERHAITVTKLAQHIDIRLKPSTAKGYKRMWSALSFQRLATTASPK
jgi:adenylosuccinate synthase